MKITHYTTDALFDDLRDEWDELLADSTADQIFLTHTWQSLWWQAYHPGQIWAVAVRDEDTGRLLGLAPWFLSDEPDGMHIVNAIGCTDVTDYLEVIARHGHEECVFDALAAFVVEYAGDYDKACLCNLPEGSLTLEFLAKGVKARGFSVATGVEDVCPIIELPERWEQYFELLDKKNRHELRRKLRRATNVTDWYIVGPKHNLREEMDRFLALMAASSEDKAKFLQDPANRAFFDAVVPAIAEKGWLHLAFLVVNGEPAASYLNFIYNNRVLVYNSGHAPDAHGHLSPGIVLLARLIEHAINEKRDVFDFLRGNESYKYDMGGKDTNVYKMVLQPEAQAAG